MYRERIGRFCFRALDARARVLVGTQRAHSSTQQQRARDQLPLSHFEPTDKARSIAIFICMAKRACVYLAEISPRPSLQRRRVIFGILIFFSTRANQGKDDALPGRLSN